MADIGDRIGEGFYFRSWALKPGEVDSGPLVVPTTKGHKRMWPLSQIDRITVTIRSPITYPMSVVDPMLERRKFFLIHSNRGRPLKAEWCTEEEALQAAKELVIDAACSWVRKGPWTIRFLKVAVRTLLQVKKDMAD